MVLQCSPVLLYSIVGLQIESKIYDVHMWNICHCDPVVWVVLRMGSGGTSYNNV